MKTFSLVAIASLFAASQAVVVRLWTEPNCGGAAAERNVYDNTCAPTGGFQSYQVITYGGSLQQLSAWDRNACAGTITSQVCAQGSNKPNLDQCINTSGGSNALSSYSNAAPCPN